MEIEKLSLADYRNYKSADFDLSPGINVFYGENAQGKTSALESIYYSAFGKSHKTTRDKDIIKFGQEEAHIKLLYKKQEIPHRIDVHLKGNGRKGIAIDGISLKRAVDLFGNVHVVLFSPDDLTIIKGAPAERRSFMDLSLCQLDKLYTYNLINYNKIIIQKNKLLKQLEEDKSLKDTLPIWNEQLCSFAREVILRRADFVKKLSDILSPIYSSISGGTEELKIYYEPNTAADEISERLIREGNREIGAKQSLFGPHRDDIRFEINGVDVRSFGSQGQQKSSALSLKLAEIELIKEEIKDTPILLLDDVLSELDSGRQQRLLSGVKGVQTVITCTGLDDFVNHNFHIDKIFRIKDGSIVSEN